MIVRVSEGRKTVKLVTYKMMTQLTAVSLIGVLFPQDAPL